MKDYSNKRALAEYLLWSAFGFLLGIVVMQVWGKQMKDSAGLFSYEWLSKFLYIEIDCKSFFYYCLKERIIILLVFILIFISNWTIAINRIISFSLGGYVGAELSLASLALGIKGPLVFIGLIFPQGIVYTATFILYLLVCHRKREHKRIIVNIALIICLFTVGILLESYVNPIILHKILKSFY